MNLTPCIKKKQTLCFVICSFICLWMGNVPGVSQAQTMPPTATYTIDELSSPSTHGDAINRAVIPANNLPVAVDDPTNVTPFGQAIDIMVLANDHDGDGGIDPITVNGFDATSVSGGTVSLNGNALRYTPAANFTGSDTFTYTISDGFSTSGAATVTVRVNTPPVASNDTGFTLPETPAVISVLANDHDGDGGIDAIAINTFDATSANGGTVTLSGSNLAYSPAAGFTGSDTFTYTISDGLDVSGAATVTMSVVDGPAANHDQATTAIGIPVTLNVLANDLAGSGATLDAASLDLDPGQGGQQATVSPAGAGTFTSDGSGNVTLTPVAGFVGTAVASYTVNDSFGTTSNVATITVQVVNTMPVAVDDQAATTTDTPVVVHVLANDSDADGDTLSLDQVSTPVHGTATINVAGTVTYTPNAGFNGTDSFTYTISDGHGGTASASVTMTVRPAFYPPQGTLTANPAALPEIVWRMVWINRDNTAANAMRVTVDVPAGTTFVEGSLTCEPTGISTVDVCTTSSIASPDVALDVAGTQITYEGTLGADAGATTEDTAANEIIITYRVAIPLGFSGIVQSQAEAHWDENGDGNIDDGIAAGQIPALSDDPTTVAPYDPTVVLIPIPTGACLFQVRHASAAQTDTGSPGESEGDNETDGAPGSTSGTEGDNETDSTAGVSQGRELTSRAAAGLLTLTTPQAGQAIAGTTVAVAAVQGPSQGVTISAPTPVTIANVTPQTVPDIVETGSVKMEFIHAAQGHVVVTAAGVLVSIPDDALATEDTLEIAQVDASNAPGPLPGESIARLYNLTLTSGQTQFASLLNLRIPYDDADQNGIVDGTILVSETDLTLWRYDSTQGIWVHLAGAIVIPDANATVVQTDQGGLIGLFRATDGRLGTVGTSDNDVVVQGTGTGGVSATDNAFWETIGIAATSPFVTPWDTTQRADGLYELRAICAVDPTALEDFITTPSAETESGSGSGCFIATAAYGSPLAPQIQVLRDFRDTYLLPNTLGHWLVEQYYRLSPPLADVIRHHNGLRAIVRIGLTPIVWAVQGGGHGLRVLLLFTCFGLFAVAGIGIVRICRRDLI